MAVLARVRFFAVMAALLLAPLLVQAAEGVRIHEVRVEGTQRIEVETIKSYVSLTEGDEFDPDRVDKSLKTLYGTGFFSDVTMRLEGSTLVVRVVENPLINRLAFEGNRKLKTEQLNTEVQLHARTVYSRTRVQADVKRILEMYRHSGRFAATVEPKIVQLDQNRVDLIFEINEGPGTFVKRINFVGNKVFSEKTLQESIQTREERWYRFMSSDDTYDPDRVNYDRDQLRKFYLRNGYGDFRVSSAVAELTPDREGFYITFTVEEGARYKYGNTVIKANLKDVKTDDLTKLLLGRTGAWYNGDEVEKNVQNLTDALGTRGFAFVDVRPLMKRDEKNHVVDVVYEVSEAPKVYVERVEIVGNQRTLDKVIRREFALVEGDAFNTAKLRRTQQRLKDLNFFEKAEVKNLPSESAADRTVVRAEIEEKSTGELSFGLGYSSLSGPMINSSMRERNLLGRGQDLTVSGGLGLKQTQASISFTEPYFLDRPLSAGWDLFDYTHNLQSQSGYDYQSYGAAVRAGYMITDHLSQSWKYMIKEDSVTNLVDGVSVYVQEEAGSYMTSSMQHSLMYDQRDSKVDPTAGYYSRLTNEFAGLGGQAFFVRNTVGAGYFYPLADQVVLMSTANYGQITDYNGRPTRITERFFLGGDSLRGFAIYGVSPRDNNTNAAIGATWDANGTTQVRFPLGLPKDFGVSGEAFTDYGVIGETDAVPLAGSSIIQTMGLRAASGVGVAWKSPMGPISVDLAYPWLRQSSDKIQIFKFNFGTRF